VEFPSEKEHKAKQMPERQSILASDSFSVSNWQTITDVFGPFGCRGGSKLSRP
jgi:hypothetical protein